ncbi:hypothetical protein K504DRAFT_56488 [Pleomassaria siparia CBS 279.74]|uniref:Uncharacterized protein n=1 Tax=Pleomassaria siparia CBS 279.74 TaxID=1314801 RepID=A0A6G1K3G3_9PLEO|nr:hypothetical protein K504DRAFT_56488 [Pleomassaria siparia CBS 279.74]
MTDSNSHSARAARACVKDHHHLPRHNVRFMASIICTLWPPGIGSIDASSFRRAPKISNHQQSTCSTNPTSTLQFHLRAIKAVALPSRSSCSHCSRNTSGHCLEIVSPATFGPAQGRNLLQSHKYTFTTATVGGSGSPTGTNPRNGKSLLDPALGVLTGEPLRSDLLP